MFVDLNKKGTIILSHYRKIPYHTNDYTEYYEDIVFKYIKLWNINEL